MSEDPCGVSEKVPAVTRTELREDKLKYIRAAFYLSLLQILSSRVAILFPYFLRALILLSNIFGL